MKTTTIVKRIVLAPATLTVVASFGIEAFAFEAIAYGLGGNNTIESMAEFSHAVAMAGVDVLLGRSELDKD